MNEEYFRVTDYPFESLNRADVTKELIQNLPVNAVVVDVGSGIFQEFARGVKSVWEDIAVVSLDPTLGINPSEPGWSLNESGDSISYIKGRSTPESDKAFSYLQTQRLRSALKDSSVAGLAPELPIASSTVDLLVDSGGAARFIPDKEIFKEYLQAINRVLKQGGKAVITDISCVAHSFTDPYWLDHSINELNEITYGILSNCDVEYTNDGQSRGMVINKKENI